MPTKHEIILTSAEGYARCNLVMLTNVAEPYFSDTPKRKQFVLVLLKAIFEIICTGYTCLMLNRFLKTSKFAPEAGDVRMILVVFLT